MKKTILRLLLYFVVLDVCVITLYPYFAMLCTALKSREEIFSGGYILELYDAVRGSYNPDFGCLELESPGGAPRVFVIGGGGSGIALYRRLQRQGIPFAAGVLHKNDLDYPVAQALASKVVFEQAFAPIGDEAFRRAADMLDSCEKVLCPLSGFGPMNEKNLLLKELAERAGKLA